MWIPTKIKKYGVAVYNYKGDTRYGLSLEIGETVQILEECAGWFRGFSTKNRAIKGIFPVAYIFLKPCKVDNEGLFECVVPQEDPVVREVTLVLREWGITWKKLYVERETYKFTTLRKVMRELLEWRRQLLTGTLTQDQTRELKLRVTAKIDWGNRKLGMDLVPRVGFQMVDPAVMSVVELYQVHVQSAESSQGASARGTLRRKDVQHKVLTHHLYFCMRDFGHHVGEDTEIFFSLYDSAAGKYISERFLVKISREGFSNYVEKMHSNCTIFTDLGNADLVRDLWLVAHVTRVGRMLYSDSVKKASSSQPPPHQLFKRPHGVAALNLSDVLLDKEGTGDEKEFTFKVYQGDEKDYHQLHEFIIKKQTSKFNPLSGQPNYGAVISLRLLHGELGQARDENPLLFKNVSLTKKLGFPDVIMPGDVRNDLYLTLDRGEFERGGKSTGKNIEVTILVLDSDGKILEDCLFGASGVYGANDYQSMIVYHHNAPAWNETLRLAVPIDKFYGSHIRLEYRHCSTRDKTDNKKLFGFSFARLMESGGATLRDGTHELHIYKCEERARLDPAVYLTLPSGARDCVSGTGTAPGFARSAKEGVTVHTLLCSTKLTQNVDLLSLLQWKEHPEQIQEALGRILRLNGEELVKFLQDVLDALFSMFSTEDGNSTTHSGLVFHALVSIFSLLDDSKFEHFKPVMDAYIKGHFAAALVYKGLLSSVQHCADWVSSTEKQEPIQKCFRSLEYIFKFIIQSRLLFARATGGQYEDSFKRDLYNVFNALNKMLATSYDVILPTQVALLHSISAVYEQLVEVLPTLEITQLATAMLESLPVRDLPPQLTQAKLTAIRNMVTSRLFTDDESRNTLLATACKHLRLHLAHRDELRLCTEILTEVLGFLFKKRRSLPPGKVNNCLHHDVEILCLTALDMLIQTVLIIIDRSAAVLGCLVACLIGLLQLLDEFHYKRLWEELGERKPRKDFLLRVFLVFRDLVKLETVFPADWLVIRMVANNVMLNSLRELAQPLVFQFLDVPQRSLFDQQLWSNYFNLAVAFLTQPSLQLEKFSEVKREKIVEKYGDMRVLMGFQILSMWSSLGEHKIHFIPSMVGPFLEVTLVPESELRKATLSIFFDMMECEQQARGNFRQVESELIDKLDLLISENEGDDEYRQLFNTILLERVQSEDPAWKESGSAFVSSVTRLLERLLDYRSVIQGDENRDKRMSCTVNLLNFYKNEINRKEMYLRYIYKLHDLHVAADNFTEAGFTLKLYADSLGWGGKPLPADAQHPDQLEWQRKELLYIKMINYFDKGKCWEQGIPLCKELAELYERRLYDYTKLSHILRTEAKFFDNILTQLRPEPEYFRVGFYGLSFPLFVRNKLFVYRGLEYERISAFTQRLQTEFPSAQILMKNSPPDDSIINSDGQFIQICNVKPLPEESVLFPRGVDLPEKIASYYQVNDVRRFQLDRPVHKGPVDKDNEFKSLWIERTTLETTSSLPGILRWFEVCRRAQQDVPPVAFAAHTMESVNRELCTLVAQFTADPRRNINPFSMRLQGIIDANVMGGITKYQQAFFTPEFAAAHPEFAEHIYRLKSLTLDQVQVLESGLALHGSLAPPGVQPLHRRLLERLAQLKAGLKDLAATLTPRQRSSESIINSPLPPLPIERRINLYSNRSSTSSGPMAVDDDDIYSKPMEVLERPEGVPWREGEVAPPPIPQREARPKSAGYNVTAELARTPTRGNVDYSSMPPLRSSRECLDEAGASTSRATRPSHQRSQSKPLNVPSDAAASVAPQRNSWSETSADDAAPPLPPRGQTSDKRGTNLFLDTTQTPPAPPKRLVKKGLNFNADSLVDIAVDADPTRDGESRDSGYAEFGPGPANNFNHMSYEAFELPCLEPNITPPVLSPRVSNLSQLPGAVPPPVPPKGAGGSPELGAAAGEREDFSTENYSVPRLLPVVATASTSS